jgi:hypothetical protein
MRWLHVLSAAALAVACGGKTAGAGGTGGAGGTCGGTGGTSTGGTSTGGTSTGGTSTGGTSTGGTSGTSCAELEGMYAAALAEAKSCNSLINSLQCTQQVNDELACPCTTYVNPANADAMAMLAKAQEEWKLQGCGDNIGCPAIACPVPQGGGCVPNGAGGDADGCQDFWPD